jgi:hypothetical protein
VFRLARPWLALALFTLACNLSIGDGSVTVGSGTAAQETRAVTGFDAIAVTGSLGVTVQVGPPASLEVRGDDNLLSHVRGEVRGSTLHLSSEGSFATTLGLSATVTLPSLVSLGNQGSADIVVTGVVGPTLTIESQGSGQLSLAGRIDALELDVQGSGDVDAKALAATRARVTVHGSADVDVLVEDSLDAQINGSGDITYRGNPAKVERRINGSGDIEPGDGGPS